MNLKDVLVTELIQVNSVIKNYAVKITISMIIALKKTHSTWLKIHCFKIKTNAYVFVKMDSKDPNVKLSNFKHKYYEKYKTNLDH